MKLKITSELSDRQFAELVSTIEGKVMANLDRLQAVMNQLVAKATETEATLAALAQAVIALKNQLANLPPDQQAAVDALADQGQAVLDGITAAEDAADDQLGTGGATGPT